MDRRIRHYGEETPFSSWLRSKNNPNEIPSSSSDLGVSFTDIDLMATCWKKKNTGKTLASAFIIEVKTRSGLLTMAQESAYSILQCFTGQRVISDQVVRFYGCTMLRMSGDSPLNSEKMWWYRYPMEVRKHARELLSTREMIVSEIDEKALISILRFDLHPISLKPFKPERSHHGKKIVLQTVKTPLGFEIEKPVERTW